MWSLTCGHTSRPPWPSHVPVGAKMCLPVAIRCPPCGHNVPPPGFVCSPMATTCPPSGHCMPPMAIMCLYGDHMSPAAITPPRPPCAPLWPSRVPPPHRHHGSLLLSQLPTLTGSWARAVGPQGCSQTPHLRLALVVLCVLGVPVRERTGEGGRWGPARFLGCRSDGSPRLTPPSLRAPRTLGAAEASAR